MGRTVPASTALLEEELGRWAKFRRAARREDKAVLDWLFERARYHSDPASYLSSRTPFDALVLAMLIKSSSSSGPPVRWTSPTTRSPLRSPPGEGGK